MTGLVSIVTVIIGEFGLAGFKNAWKVVLRGQPFDL